jgi:hypothetical protein
MIIWLYHWFIDHIKWLFNHMKCIYQHDFVKKKVEVGLLFSRQESRAVCRRCGFIPEIEDWMELED